MSAYIVHFERRLTQYACLMYPDINDSTIDDIRMITKDLRLLPESVIL